VRPRPLSIFGSTLCVLLVPGHAALAHHVMDRKLPASMAEGLLSGLGHPVIGIDHLAAVVAVGILAAAHQLGPALAVGYMLAQVAGTAIHVRGATVPGAELLVALSVLALGAATLRRQALGPVGALGLFVLAGLVHGYALAESIVGAEPTPLTAYFAGFVIVQTAIALAVMMMARRLAAGGNAEPVRLTGAAIIGVGLASLVQQIVPNA
jgi:urease accessory protein